LGLLSDEIIALLRVVLAALAIRSDHHQTEQNASGCGEQRSRSARPRLCLLRGVGTSARAPGSCLFVCLFV